MDQRASSDILPLRSSSEGTGKNYPQSVPVDDQSVEALKSGIIAKLVSTSGKNPSTASDWDWYFAAALAVRDRITHRSLDSDRDSQRRGLKRVYYLSIEFLIGRLLFDALINLGTDRRRSTRRSAISASISTVCATLEPDAALGNGGLGRLAACFMDSMATLGIPAYGYGIRYEHGLFRAGHQRRLAAGTSRSTGCRFGNPWEFERPRYRVFDIRFGGYASKHRADGDSRAPRSGIRPRRSRPSPTTRRSSAGAAGTSITLRLWSARAVDPILLDTFNRATMSARCASRCAREAISQVLYPSDATPAGQELRLRQEYFFTSASLQDIVAPASAALRRHSIAARPGRDPAQRYASRRSRSPS